MTMMLLFLLHVVYLLGEYNIINDLLQIMCGDVLFISIKRHDFLSSTLNVLSVFSVAFDLDVCDL